jgi:hypothetical protein
LSRKAAAILPPALSFERSSGRGLKASDRRAVQRLLQILHEAVPASAIQRQISQKPTTEKLIFFSHSSKDADLAEALVELIAAALHLRLADFRCTSVEGAKLRGGDLTESVLRYEIIETPVFVSLITPNALESHYVLFELGARWGVSKHHIPVLAKGSQVEVIKEPLKAINALTLTKEADVFQLVDDVAHQLKTRVEPASVYRKKVTAVVRLARLTSSKKGKKSTPVISPLTDGNTDRVDPQSEMVLAKIADSLLVSMFPLETSHELGMNRLRIEKSIDILAERKLVDVTDPRSKRCNITPLGKRYLFDHGII